LPKKKKESYERITAGSQTMGQSMWITDANDILDGEPSFLTMIQPMQVL